MCLGITAHVIPVRSEIERFSKESGHRLIILLSEKVIDVKITAKVAIH